MLLWPPKPTDDGEAAAAGHDTRHGPGVLQRRRPRRRSHRPPQAARRSLASVCVKRFTAGQKSASANRHQSGRQCDQARATYSARSCGRQCGPARPFRCRQPPVQSRRAGPATDGGTGRAIVSESILPVAYVLCDASSRRGQELGTPRVVVQCFYSARHEEKHHFGPCAVAAPECQER